ncbi:hypothetical protein BC629DRAFT_1515059 [Irpex lacteus]|nr:hypothetical protein BC629DRAFT_1515059 [Irpex lacteus]
MRFAEKKSAIMQAPITVASPGGLVNEPDGEKSSQNAADEMVPAHRRSSDEDA